MLEASWSLSKPHKDSCNQKSTARFGEEYTLCLEAHMYHVNSFDLPSFVIAGNVWGESCATISMRSRCAEENENFSKIAFLGICLLSSVFWGSAYISGYFVKLIFCVSWNVAVLPICTSKLWVRYIFISSSGENTDAPIELSNGQLINP